MKIIFSPAKTLNLSNPIQEDWNINEKTEKIVSVLKGKDSDELKKILKISDKILSENLEYIKNFDKKISYKAIEMYDGLAFKSLNINNMPFDSLEYLNENLCILSAFYGVLKPCDLVKAYRLDFNSKLKLNEKTLKNFWKDYYNSYFKEGETILNLASNEFSDLFYKKRYDWYDFDFFELKENTKKRHSTISKKARGIFLCELALNKIYYIKDVKKLSFFGKMFEFQ